jgi:hypothetical protein
MVAAPQKLPTKFDRDPGRATGASGQARDNMKDAQTRLRGRAAASQQLKAERGTEALHVLFKAPAVDDLEAAAALLCTSPQIAQGVA